MQDLQKQFNDFWAQRNKGEFLTHLRDLNSYFVGGVISQPGGENLLIEPDYLVAYYGLKKDIPIQEVDLTYDELIKYKFNDIKDFLEQVHTALNSNGVFGWVSQIFSYITNDNSNTIFTAVSDLFGKLWNIINNVVDAVGNATKGIANIAQYLPIILIVAVVFLSFTYIKGH